MGLAQLALKTAIPMCTRRCGPWPAGPVTYPKGGKTYSYTCDTLARPVRLWAAIRVRDGGFDLHPKMRSSAVSRTAEKVGVDPSDSQSVAVLLILRYDGAGTNRNRGL
jgi:hypothetical protein